MLKNEGLFTVALGGGKCPAIEVGKYVLNSLDEKPE
jgi:hypothetical protein